MHWNSNNTFNPLDQPVTVLAPDGSTSYTLDVSSISLAQRTAVFRGICAGSQVGAATLLLACLVMTTKAEKRRSAIFMLNVLALVLVVARGVFDGINYQGPFLDWYRVELQYYAGAAHAKAISICAGVADIALVAVLQVSLVLQIRIVCCTLDHWRHLVNSVSMLTALLVIASRLAFGIVEARWNILGVEHETAAQWQRLNELASAVNIVFVIGIAVPASIFCAKLLFAIQRRRSMGITCFGPMQIVLIMGFQNMLLPFVILIITYWGVPNAQMQTFGPPIVALCLPLSAMWAAAHVTNVHFARASPQDMSAVAVAPDKTLFTNTSVTASKV